MPWMNFNILIGAFTPNPVYLDGVLLFYSPLWLSLSPREPLPHTQWVRSSHECLPVDTKADPSKRSHDFLTKGHLSLGLFWPYSRHTFVVQTHINNANMSLPAGPCWGCGPWRERSRQHAGVWWARTWLRGAPLGQWRWNPETGQRTSTRTLSAWIQRLPQEILNNQEFGHRSWWKGMWAIRKHRRMKIDKKKGKMGGGG